MLSLKRLNDLQTYDLWMNCGLGVATVFVLAGVYVAGIRPFHVQFQDVRNQSQALQDLIRQTSEITEKHQQLSAELAASKQSAATLMQRIPAAPRESDFLSQVCQLADETGLEVADYHPGIIDTRENHQEMEVKISSRGEYAAVCKFLKEIDHLPRLCRLTSLDIDTEKSGDRLAVELLFRIYFAPPTTPDATKKG